MRRLVLRALAILLAMPAAASAAAPGDPYYRTHQWGPQQVRAEEAWTTSTGAGTQIAIVDSGVDLDHPDLAAKIAGGATFACDDGRQAPCGDGDWESGRNSDEGEGDPHGTHVAGIAAAITDNATGIAGVAPDAEILAVKALGGDGSGSFEDIAQGIRWSVDNGADVVNLSLGAPPGAQALTLTGVISDVQDAIAYARSKNVVVVAAAGNEAAPLCSTPAFDKGALCVAATDRREAKAWYSNLAVKADDEGRIDAVAAPGGQGLVSCREDIVSTVPESAGGTCTRILGTPGYDFYAGTSMAAPHVSGVAALLMAQGRSDENAVDVLEQTARTPLTGARGVYTPVYGYGIVDAAAAVAAPGADEQASAPPSEEPPAGGPPADEPASDQPPGGEPPRDQPAPRDPPREDAPSQAAPPQRPHDGNAGPGSSPASASAPSSTAPQAAAPPRVRLVLRVRRSGRCLRARARLRGADAHRVRRASFRVRGRAVRTDRRAPFSATVRVPRRRATVVVRAVLDDGRAVKLRRRVRGC